MHIFIRVRQRGPTQALLKVPGHFKKQQVSQSRTNFQMDQFLIV